ncbi:MAG: Maltose phosphorylase, partial [Bacteroidota bacterium]
MKEYLSHHNWKIVEEGFHPEFNEITESIFSLGNGRMGQRGNFEEKFTGKSLQGNYIAGVYYPDKTRVGWWKNGYPEYFAKVLNATNWIGLNIKIDNIEIDINQLSVINFYRELDMQHGLLNRNMVVELPGGKQIEIKSTRLNNIVWDESGALKYSIKALNFSGKLEIEAYLDGDIKNRDSNYDEKFWDPIKSFGENNESFVWLKTKKTGFEVLTAQSLKIFRDGDLLNLNSKAVVQSKYTG